MSVLLEPFAYDFFRSGILVATVAGALCGLVGVLVVLRGMSYIGHGLSHAVFGGAVASYVMSVNFFVGAGVWAFAVALLISAVARRRGIGADAAIGIVTTASFAVGLVLISRYKSFTRDFDAALFGNVLGVTGADVLAVTIAFGLAVIVVVGAYRRLLFVAFDPDVAEASGLNVTRIDAAFSLVLAATIVTTMRVLGVTLVAAALVIPAVVARMLTDSFARMLALATVIGAASGSVGMNLSYHLDVASGATVVLVSTAVFAAVFAVTGFRRRGRAISASLH